MKKIVLVLGFLIVAGICFGIFFYSPEKLTPENPLGKTVYYTMIKSPGFQSENGRYDYEMTAYSEKEKAKKIKFFDWEAIERRSLYSTVLYIDSRCQVMGRSYLR